MTSPFALELESVHVKYGGIAACQSVSLHVRRGEIVALIGANGAGKSSVLKSILRLVPHASGQLRVLGHDVQGMSTHGVVALGTALVPEGRAIFGNLSVRENLLLGAFLNRAPAAIEKNLARCVELFPRLGERMTQNAGTLSGGEQQMLAIGRGLMSEPVLLIMDEPSLGLSPLLVEEMFALIQNINRAGQSILLMEQNAVQSLAIAHRAYIIENGAVAMQGVASELARDPALRKNYLGL